MKDWSELWQKFIELTPLTTTAEPNSEVEYITHALVSMCTEKLTAPPDVYASTYCLMSDVVAVLTEKLRYSELGKTSVRSKFNHIYVIDNNYNLDKLNVNVCFSTYVTYWIKVKVVFTFLLQWFIVRQNLERSHMHCTTWLEVLL